MLAQGHDNCSRDQIGMIKVFGMARGGTNILCNMIYSYPEVERPKHVELQTYIYRNNPSSKLRIRIEKFLYADYLHNDNYDAHKTGSKKIKNVIGKLRDRNYLIKVMNGNIAYYDDINQPVDRNIILLRDKLSVFGSLVRRGAKPVAAINNINNFYKFSDYYARRDKLLVVHFEDMLSDYDRVLGQVSEYLGYRKIDKVYLGLKPTLTNRRTGRERVCVNVSDVPNYLDRGINEEQISQVRSFYDNEQLDLYTSLLAC